MHSPSRVPRRGNSAFSSHLLELVVLPMYHTHTLPGVLPMPVMPVTDRRGRQAAGVYQAFPIRVKLYTHWSDTCAVNERVVETDIPENPMPSIQQSSQAKL